MMQIPELQDCKVVYANGQAEVELPERKAKAFSDSMSAAGYILGEGLPLPSDKDYPCVSITLLYDPEKENTFIEHLQTVCRRNNLVLGTIYQKPISES